MLIVGLDLWYNSSRDYTDVCSLGHLRQIALDGLQYPKNHFFIKGPSLLSSCGVINVGYEPQLCSRTSITRSGCLGLRRTSGSEGTSWIWPLPFSPASTSCKSDTTSCILPFALEEYPLMHCVTVSLGTTRGLWEACSHCPRL